MADPLCENGRVGCDQMADLKELVVKKEIKETIRVVSVKRLSRVTAEQLADDAELVAIFLRCVRLELVPDSGASRLRVWGAACHALRVGDDPAAMFCWLVQGGHWGHVAGADEDRALDRLRGLAD